MVSGFKPASGETAVSRPGSIPPIHSDVAASRQSAAIQPKSGSCRRRNHGWTQIDTDKKGTTVLTQEVSPNCFITPWNPCSSVVELLFLVQRSKNQRRSAETPLRHRKNPRPFERDGDVEVFAWPTAAPANSRLAWPGALWPSSLRSRRTCLRSLPEQRSNKTLSPSRRRRPEIFRIFPLPAMK